MCLSTRTLVGGWRQQRVSLAGKGQHFERGPLSSLQTIISGKMLLLVFICCYIQKKVWVIGSTFSEVAPIFRAHSQGFTRIYQCFKKRSGSEQDG